MLQLVLTILIYLIMVIPVGSYLYHIAAGKHTFADPVLNRVDDVIYKISGIDPHKKMDWKKYALALLGTNAVMILLGYMILRIQSIPIFNPNGVGAMEESLSFNTIISFMTNTNLQHYSGGIRSELSLPDAGHYLYDVCFRSQRICCLCCFYPWVGWKKQK